MTFPGGELKAKNELTLILIGKVIQLKNIVSRVLVTLSFREKDPIPEPVLLSRKTCY